MIIWKLPRKVSKIIAAVQQIGQSHARIGLKETICLIIQNTVIQISTGGTKRGIQASTWSRKKVIGRITIATVIIEVEETIEPIRTTIRSTKIRTSSANSNMSLNFLSSSLDIFREAGHFKNRLFISRWGNNVGVSL